MKPVGEVVTIVRTTGGGVDPDGYPIPGTTERIPVPGTVVDFGASGRTSDNYGIVTVTEKRVLFPTRIDLEADDTLEIRGDTYLLDGEPFTDVSQWGMHHVGGTVATITRGSS